MAPKPKNQPPANGFKRKVEEYISRWDPWGSISSSVSSRTSRALSGKAQASRPSGGLAGMIGRAMSGKKKPPNPYSKRSPKR